jgi:hypothetical protein
MELGGSFLLGIELPRECDCAAVEVDPKRSESHLRGFDRECADGASDVDDYRVVLGATLPCMSLLY